jgi:prevent-host-death family protein
MSNRTNLNLNVDLQRGVVPISKAASSLAALIKRAHTSGQPVIVTQKGYPTGVLLPIELFSALKALADGEDAAEVAPLPEPVAEIIDSLDQSETSPEPEEAPKSRRPAAKRRKRADEESPDVGV